MEWAFATYAALIFVAVPMFRTEGIYGLDYAKDQLFTAMTALMLVAAMFHGKLCLPGSPWILGFFGFAFLSILWCDHPHLGRREVIRLAATFAFVGLVSQLPQDYLILACFLPAPVIAAYGAVQQVWRRDFCDPRFEATLKKRTRFQTWFGNSNYAGAYLCPQFFLGVWLTMNHSWIYGIPTTIVLIGLALSQCRAAQVSVIMGVAILVPWAIPVLAIGGFLAYRKYPGCMESVGHRFLMARAAFEIWKKWPLFGAGPRCFRHKHTRATAELNLKDETILGRPGKPGRYQFTVGRRAHNDYAETFAEYGLIGVAMAGAMFASILWGLRGDLILFAAATVVLANAAFFFPFRDTALSLPFWMIVATTGIGTQIPVGLVPALIGSALVLYLAYLYAYKPFLANWVSDRGNQVKALQLQPYASEYLYRIAVDALNQKQHVLAFNCAEKALFLYDGERPEWAILHMFGQIAIVNGALGIAKSSFDQALMIYPTSPDVLKSLRDLHGVLRQIENNEKQAA